ncbi:MAG TPA: hypothetical protein VL128_00890 [Candidatus Eisenbacteria bacterium]|nr:hypothetical protein [Candidatus Eisenbacteria bacterium]
MNGRLVLIGVAAIAAFSARAIAQEAAAPGGNKRDALYAQSDWLKATFPNDVLWPGDPLAAQRGLALPLSNPSLWEKGGAPDEPSPGSRGAGAMNESGSGSGSGASASSGSSSSAEPLKREKQGTRVRWGPATMEALYYTGIMHAFNLSMQPGTRDTLNGHWLQHWSSSVSELRGWSDGDTFMAPYVGHPIEGSVFGYILRQNDPKYRTVQLGDGRDYYVSLLRSMAFSALWHTQWKIGPASEASLGNVMLHASPGFITLVDTPTLGAITMLAEDAADRYVVMGLENRTSNRAAIILARSFLNPGRTMANLMAFRPPWVRDTRLNLFGEQYELRKELLREYKDEGGEKPFEFVKRTPVDYGTEFRKQYPLAAPIELEAFPYYESFLGGGSCVGGGGQGAARVNGQWQVVTEVSGCLIMHMPQSNQSGDSMFFGAGPRWTPRASEKISPYAQLLIGGRRVTHEIDNTALRTELMKEWADGEGTLAHYPTRFDWSVERQAFGFSLAAGSGVDVVLTRAFAWRVLNVEYTHTWIPDVDMIHAQNGIKVTTGAVLRIGTW